MKKSWRALVGTKVFTTLAVLSPIVIPLAYPAPAYATTSVCGKRAPNLVQNPGFESVNSAHSTPSKWYIASNEVPYWSRPIGDPMNFPWVQTNGAAEISPSWEGSKSAVISGINGLIGIAGDLASPMTTGSTYEVSAQIAVEGTGDPAKFELQLRDSATGVESTIIAQKTTGNLGTSQMLAATVIPNASYDQIVVRHQWLGGSNNAGYGIIDDVHVTCKQSAPLPWWMNHGVQAGLAMFLLGAIGGLLTWGTHRSRGRGSKSSHKSARVAVADVNGDGNADISVEDVNQDGRLDGFKVSENESPRPQNRSFLQKYNLGLGIVSLVVAVAGIYVAGASGGIWKNKTFTSVTVPTDSRDTTKTNTTTAPTTVKTCKDKETVATGYKLFYSDTYKYCIEYPTAWPVEQSKPDMVTFGTVNPEPTPGWFKVTHFKDKSSSTRTEEIMANYREPAGPCTTSTVKIADQSAERLDCIGAANGEDRVYVLLGHGHDLYELSNVEGMGAQKASYDAQYKVMVDSFKADTVTIE